MDNAQPLDVLRRRVLELVESPKYRPQKPKMFAEQLGLPEDEKTTVRRIIRKMVKEGQLAFGKSHLVLPPRCPPTSRNLWSREQDPAAKKELKGKEGKNSKARYNGDDHDSERKRRERKAKGAEFSGHYLVGTFRRKPSGIGFVRLKNQDAENPVPDLYIAAHHTQDAASGDTVAVELLEGRRVREERERRTKKSGRVGRREDGREPSDFGDRARIIKVLERATDRFVGTFFERDNHGFVQIDGERFAKPLLVGDPGAASARPGDKVVVEMIAFPDAHGYGEAVIVEVLGPHGVPGIDTLLILREFNLPDQFSEKTLTAARKVVHGFLRLFPDDATVYTERTGATLPDTPGLRDTQGHAPPGIPDGRYDATGELIITIDPADAKDFDDAVSLQRTSEGNWLLGVHIADVAHFVKEGGDIDREAKDRGTSVYLPDRVIPMLPEVLCNALASLQPGKRRLAKSVYMEFTPEGIRAHVEIKRSVIRSARRFHYAEVQEFLDDPGAFEKEWPLPIREMLTRMYEFAMLLRKRRFRHGAVEMNLPEVKIDFDGNGAVAGAHEYPYYDSNRIIEEFMLAANGAVAEFLSRKNILFLRRVHRFPTLKKMRAFADFVRSLGIDDLDAEEMLENRYVLQRLLDKVRGTPEERPVNLALLRSMQRAEYSPNAEGHYALASACYCHFTSPIRRYPDLAVHRLVELVLQGKNPKPDRRTLTLLGEHCSDRERRAADAAGELVKLKLIDYLSKRIGTEMDGIITGIESFGMFVQGTGIPAEGLVRLDTLTDDFYRFDRQLHTLSGGRVGNVFRLGDRVRVRVVRADADTRRIDFRFLERLSPPRNANAEPPAKPTKNTKAGRKRKSR